MKRTGPLRLAGPTLCLLAAASLPSQRPPAWPSFESPQVHPVDVTPDGTRLVAINTPDNRLAVFALNDPARPTLLGEVEVGLEPVSVRVASDGEAWVVQHLSDTVSVVDLDVLAVVATLRCSDEPADVVFAAGRAFVSCATAREVLVFDLASRTLIGRVAVFADEPRALATDGTSLWVASMRSGNDTTILERGLAPPQPPPTNPALPPAPLASRVVDSEDPAWSALHGVDLPDYDVFEIDVRGLTIRRTFTALGTTLFGLAVAPDARSLWVSHTDARNLVRFEPNLRGHVVANAVTRIDLAAGGGRVRHDLDAGIDHRVLPNPFGLGHALAQPVGMAWAPDGRRLFVAAFGTDRIGVLEESGRIASRIEIGSTPGTRVAPREKRGPRGVVHHPTAPVLYVLNRLANSLSTVDTAVGAEVGEQPLVHDPTPPGLRAGRGFLYDAKLSGNGTAACAACHVDATYDGLAWDLGDPGGSITRLAQGGEVFDLHPMKGPMLTQTLQGTAETGPLHWRGDRTDLRAFNASFATLLGGQPLSAGDLDALAAFIASVSFPPNPNEALDRTLSTDPPGDSAAEGRDFFVNDKFFRGLGCIDCHALPRGTGGQLFPPGLVDGPQTFKAPQLRGLYKRTGSIPASDGRRTAGFGILHDGARRGLVDLHSTPGIHFYDSNQKQHAFMMVFPTGLAPAVGWMRTLSAGQPRDPMLSAEWTTVELRALVGECDLVVHGSIGGRPIGLLYDPATGRYLGDQANSAPLARAELLQRLDAAGGRMTVLGVVPGHGRRIALDRDEDGVLDGDERPVAFGASTAGCSGFGLSASSPPWTGNSQFGVVVRGGPRRTPGVIWLGRTRVQTSVLGLELLVAPELTAAITTDGRGDGILALPIPDEPALAGATLHAQALFPNMSCGNVAGLAATHGLTISVR